MTTDELTNLRIGMVVKSLQTGCKYTVDSIALDVPFKDRFCLSGVAPTKKNIAVDIHKMKQNFVVIRKELMKTGNKIGLVLFLMLVSSWCGFFMAYIMEFTQNYLRFG